MSKPKLISSENNMPKLPPVFTSKRGLMQSHWYENDFFILMQIQSDYYGQFALSLEKENPYFFSKFNPLYRDTLWTFYGPLSVSFLELGNDPLVFHETTEPV